MYNFISKFYRLLFVSTVALVGFSSVKLQAELINWVNVPIGEFVIPRYEAISGKRLMVDGSVAGSSITINSQIDMEPEEAIEFIKKVEEVCELPVDIVSTGPDDEGTIVVNEDI